MLDKARLYGNGCDKRIFIKGNTEVTLDVAKTFAKAKILRLENKPQTVEPENAPLAVHKVLFGQEIV